MKRFKSIEEGKWVELLNGLTLTEEQKALLISKEEGDKVAKEELARAIKNSLTTQPTEEEIAMLDTIYTEVKAELEGMEDYKIVAFRVAILENGYKYSLEYKLGEESKTKNNF